MSSDSDKTSAPAFDQTKTSHEKAFPVILLLDISGSMNDTSGSMSERKIDSLNKAVKTMLETWAQLDKKNRVAKYHVAVITFANSAKLHLPYTKVSLIQWQDLEAGGQTYLGEALTLAMSLIKKENCPPRTLYYDGVVVLVSDGLPNDEWKKPLEDFIALQRIPEYTSAVLYALLIGDGADKEFLKRFRDDAGFEISKGPIPLFFQLVTKKVTEFFTKRTQNPRPVPDPKHIKLDGGTIISAPTGPSPGGDDETKGGGLKPAPGGPSPGRDDETKGGLKPAPGGPSPGGDDDDDDDDPPGW